MIDIERQVRIDAPVEDVFEYVDRPENQPEFTPSLTRSQTLAELPNGGKRVAYRYAMAGVSLDGELEAIEYEPQERVRWKMTGDLTGEIEWTFEADNGGTLLAYAARYDLPIPVLDAVVEPFAERYNERELETTLENLRARLEYGLES
jgi:uncharacterized membrane protein